MKLEMCQVLAIGFLVLLFFDAVQARICLYCRNVDSKNVCQHRELTCDAGSWRYCFTRKVIQDNVVRRVHRGCVTRCISTETKRRVVFSRCCRHYDYCNEVNGWTLNQLEDPQIPY